MTTSYTSSFPAMDGIVSHLEMSELLKNLAARTNPKDPAGPPWSWPNLTMDEITKLDTALDEFVTSYNRVHVLHLEEIIPACWRLHPALAQELPVQFWVWWTSHISPTATVHQAVDYYSRILPQFQQRLQTRLLGNSAPKCRTGEHRTLTNAEVDPYTGFSGTEHPTEWGRTDPNRNILHSLNFGTQADRA